jgi:predicted dehydrogenase
MVRAAIVGLGRWGRTLVRSVEKDQDVFSFVAAYTRTRETATGFCQDMGLPLAASYEEILADRTIEAVVLATPHSQHEDQVTRAAAAGKHVFVEKPIALTLQSAKIIVEAARQAGVVLAVGFVRRFHPSIGEMRARLADGRLGTLVGMVGQQTSGTGPFLPKEGWRVDPNESPGGAMTSVGVHLLDHMIEFGGRVSEVNCLVQQRGSNHDDTTSVFLRFDSGVTGLLFCSVSTAPNFSFTTYGSKGLIEITQTDLQQVRLVAAPTEAPTGPVKAPPPEFIHHPGFNMMRAELLAFAHSVRTGEVFPVRLDEVLHGMAVFEAIVASSRSGRPVKIEPGG